MSDKPHCRNLTEEECCIVHRIEKMSRTYDEICRMINQIVSSLGQNDWYFIQHSFQMREDAQMGKTLGANYVKELGDDSQDYHEEINRIIELLQRALALTTVREIEFLDDDIGDGDGDLPAQ